LSVLGNGADLLIVRADRKEPLVVIPLRLAPASLRKPLMRSAQAASVAFTEA
jgi:hypothetical protein